MSLLTFQPAGNNKCFFLIQLGLGGLGCVAKWYDFSQHRILTQIVLIYILPGRSKARYCGGRLMPNITVKQLSGCPAFKA